MFVLQSKRNNVPGNAKLFQSSLGFFTKINYFHFVDFHYLTIPGMQMRKVTANENERVCKITLKFNDAAKRV
jgi:hypothetical protein